jgi:hypothetical protein
VIEPSHRDLRAVFFDQHPVTHGLVPGALLGQIGWYR